MENSPLTNWGRVISVLLLLWLLIAGIYDYAGMSKVSREKHEYDATIQKVVGYVPQHRWSNFLPIEIAHGDRTKQQVIFTFDAGDSAISGEAILATLSKHHVKGTFFMTGKFVEANPALVREIAKAGHEIFNHTYDHPHLTELSDDLIVAELSRMDALLASTTGLQSHPYFRPPYGDRDARVIRVAANAGYKEVYWTADAHDWEESTGETAEQVRQDIMNNLAPGTIYLMHVGDTITGSILDDVFTKIESRGYKIMSLSQGL